MRLQSLIEFLLKEPITPGFSCFAYVEVHCCEPVAACEDSRAGLRDTARLSVDELTELVNRRNAKAAPARGE